MHLPILRNQRNASVNTAPPSKMDANFQLRDRNHNAKRGFTLVEILVVMGIIATLLGIGVGAIKGLATSKGVSTAVPLAESVFNQARQVAKATGAPTRVVIFADSNGSAEEHRTRYLRMIGVATGRDSQGNTVESGSSISEWRLVSRPVTLPNGAYFNENLSIHSGSGSAIFPGSSSSRSCFVYEFNSEGALISASGDGSGESEEDGQFVIQAGKLNPGADRPNEDNNAKRDAGGFRVFENGRIAKFRSVSQIDGESDPQF